MVFEVTEWDKKQMGRSVLIKGKKGKDKAQAYINVRNAWAPFHNGRKPWLDSPVVERIEIVEAK